MIQNISFCGNPSRYIWNKGLGNATLGEIATTMNKAVEDASKAIGREIKTLTGKKYTGTMIKDANYHLIKNGHLTEEGVNAFKKMYGITDDKVNLDTCRKIFAKTAAQNVYAESDKGSVILTRDLKYVG